MFIYNITTKVDKAHFENWRDWQLNEHIPEIMATGLFIDFKMYHLLDQDEGEGVTFVLQLFFNTKNSYDLYIQNFAPSLREKAINKWGNNFISYRTVMQAVQ